MCDSDLALLQGLFGRSGGINDVPVDRANIILFLQPGDLACGVRCIALAAANAALPGRKVGFEKKPDKADILPARGLLDRGSFRFTGKHRVDHDGMALDKDAQGALEEGIVNLLGNPWLVGARGQPVRFIELKVLLPQNVAA